MGNAFAFTGNLNAALLAASRIFSLLDRKPKIDMDPDKGNKVNQVEGNVADGSTGQVACDSYHKYREDVRLLKAREVRLYGAVLNL